MVTCDLKSAGWLKIRYRRLRVKDDWLGALRIMELSSLLPVLLLFPSFPELKRETQEVTRHLVFTAFLSLPLRQNPVEERLHAITCTLLPSLSFIYFIHLSHRLSMTGVNCLACSMSMSWLH